MTGTEDLVRFIDDGGNQDPQLTPSPWRMLIVDDDAEVHHATQFALQHVDVLGRPLAIHHAYSAAEARALLRDDRDFAVILLDVVMETEDAGLRMVSHIREELGMWQVRIILRTGQPGYAPEISVFNNYDINDYRTKVELTRTRLLTAITAAIRSYHQIHTISENRRGLELIVRATADLMDVYAVNSFAEGVLTQIAALLRLPLSGVVCAQRGSPFGDDDHSLYVIGAAGQLSGLIGKPLSKLENADITDAIARCFQQRTHSFGKQYTTVYLGNDNQEAVIFLSTSEPLNEPDRQLIEVFASNISAWFANLRLFEQLSFLAYNDPLTRLKNLTGFEQAVDALKQYPRDNQIALIDLQDFSGINAKVGYATGDLVLQAVAQRLKTLFGTQADIARLEADVFALIAPAAQLANERLESLWSEPVDVGGHKLSLRAHISIITPHDSDGAGHHLLLAARETLAEAKRQGTSGILRR